MSGIDLAPLVLGFPAFLLALTVHEYSHAWMAAWLGDNTAVWLGRLTLNPLPHIDPVGTLLFPLLGLASGGMLFGWAKPVPFVPSNLKNPVRDTMLIALAGPASNVVLAALSAVLLRLLGTLTILGAAGPVYGAISVFLIYCLYVNTILAVFNMVPVPPLDGSKVLTYFLPYSAQNAYRTLEPYGFVILVGLMFTGVFELVIAPAIAVVSLVAGLNG